MNRPADDKSTDTHHLPRPVVKKVRWPALFVWIIPLAAAVIAGYYFYDLRQQHGPELTIKFTDVSGLKIGQAHAMHLGIDVGLVKAATLSPDNKQAIVTVQLQRNAEAFAKKGALFWIVRPEISVQSISGLATVLSGPYIEAIPGDGPTQQEFTGLEKAPATLDPGIHIILHTPRLDRLQSDVPVYYRGIHVGVIEDIQLSPGSETVDVHAFIEQRYAPLVKTNTKFWIISAVDVQGGLLSGIHMKVGSLGTLLSGGITFATPEDDMGYQAADGSQFALYNESKKEWLDWQPYLPLGPTSPSSRSTDTKLPETPDEVRSLVGPK